MKRHLGLICLIFLFLLAFSGSDLHAAQLTYIVKPGDNLWNIAVSHGTSVDKLKALNNLPSDMLKPGQVLFLSRETPTKQATTQSAPPTAVVNRSGSDGFYVIQAGDTLSAIADSFGLTVFQLKWLNNLTTDEIFVGEKLSVDKQRLTEVSRSGISLGNPALIIQKASQYIGTPYRYGGEGPGGFDCSGFVRYIYSNFGIKLPHSAAAQSAMGQAVSREELLPGDLVFFCCGRGGIDHVGIYCGSDSFIHSSSPRSGGVIYSSLSEGYYARTYHSATRIL